MFHQLHRLRFIQIDTQQLRYLQHNKYTENQNTWGTVQYLSDYWGSALTYWAHTFFLVCARRASRFSKLYMNWAHTFFNFVYLNFFTKFVWKKNVCAQFMYNLENLLALRAHNMIGDYKNYMALAPLWRYPRRPKLIDNVVTYTALVNRRRTLFD
jgi:hypothetical protein